MIVMASKMQNILKCEQNVRRSVNCFPTSSICFKLCPGVLENS